METKRCKYCRDALDPVSNWPGHLCREGKRLCRTCYNWKKTATGKVYREKNREKACEATKRWRAENPEKYQAQLDAAKARRKENTSE